MCSNINIEETQSGNYSEPAIQASTGTLSLTSTGGTVKITAKRPVENLKIQTPEGILAEPDEIPFMIQDDEQKITFTIKQETTREGNITITWEENEQKSSLHLPFFFSPPPDESSNPSSLAGRILGMISLFI